MKNILKFCFVLTLILLAQVVYADGDINLVVKNNGAVVLSVAVPLPGAGIVDVSDSGGNPHSIDARSVLNIVSLADASSSDFDISNLIYYSSFSAFYLKCIKVSGSDLCDLWQYKVNGTDPGMGMDQDILSGGESMVLFFGDENPATPITSPQTGNSGGEYHSGGSSGPISVLPVVVEPIALPVTPLPAESVVVEVKPITPVASNTPKPEIKRIVSKTHIKKEIAKVSTLAKESLATVFVAGNSSTTPPAKKESWVKTILKWIFGF